jgi:hypothetical protein
VRVTSAEILYSDACQVPYGSFTSGSCCFATLEATGTEKASSRHAKFPEDNQVMAAMAYEVGMC